jgi:nitroreductase
MNNPTIETIFRRRSIRKYTDQPVEPEKLNLLLHAAMAAPTAMNCKPWEFIVVTDP